MTKIYHFTKLNTAIEFILPKKQLRTSSLHKMNDPKESQPWAFGGINLNYEGWYPENYSEETHIDTTYNFGNDIKSNVQIICFVKDKPEKGFLNEIMWAHYSDNHQGICLEIDRNIFIKENFEQLTESKFEPVSYGQHENPFIFGDHSLNKEENIKKIIEAKYKELFLRKSKYWKRENEERLIMFTNKQHYLSIENSLTGIYFGLDMCIHYLPSIIRLINKQQTKLFDLYFENNRIKIIERDFEELRPMITKKFKNVPHD